MKIKGNKCSTNFVSDGCINSIEQLDFPEVSEDSILMSTGLNLKELEEKLDKILKTETEESLKEWLNKKRNL